MIEIKPVSHYGKNTLSKPEWLKIKLPIKEQFSSMKSILREHNLVTVCEEAQCPNISECWQGENTATFMVLGEVCTRGCKFCAVKTAKVGQTVDVNEPANVAAAIAKIGLDYAVITSVDRDDLPDEGAGHFAQVISEIKKQHPSTLVEVLIPDFKGNKELVAKIVDASPEVIAHNIETVSRLQKVVRDPRAGYEQSLSVLRIVKEMNPKILTKSALMVGLGETKEEMIQAMKDLRAIDCDILTIGQYLQPKHKVLKVKEYVTPEIFEEYKRIGMELGFKYVASGPFVRSSYRAGELFVKNILKNKKQS